VEVEAVGQVAPVGGVAALYFVGQAAEGSARLLEGVDFEILVRLLRLGRGGGHCSVENAFIISLCWVCLVEYNLAI